MSTAYFKTLGQIEDRVVERMGELRQAERDIALHCSGMAFDGSTAEDIYRAGLEHLGIPRSETASLSVAGLRILLKNQPKPGSREWRNAPAMAFDSKSPSPLDAILDGIKPPPDHSRTSIWR